MKPPIPDQEPVRLPLPEQDPIFQGAREVVRRLRDHGHEAWCVGGGVRDLFLGSPPKDWDIATSATPDEVRRLFPRNIPVGMQFGVIRVRLKNREYEVATFREDLGYSDGRRPDQVHFGGLAEDVRRRDFTINGLALDPVDGTILDLVGGIADLRQQRIRAIGDPGTRFAEDHLRPLRAIRIAARTGFSIEDATWEAILVAAPTVATVSPERIAEELGRLLEAPFPGTGWRLLDRSGLRAVVLPAWQGPVEATAEALDRLRGSPLPLMWAAALCPIGPRQARAILRDLRRSRELASTVAAILEVFEELGHLPMADLAREKRLLRRPEVPAALAVFEAWRPPPRADPDPVLHARQRLSTWGPEELFPRRLLDGHDLARLGIPPGPRMAAVLQALEDAQLRGILRKRSEAMTWVQSLEEGPAPP